MVGGCRARFDFGSSFTLTAKRLHIFIYFDFVLYLASFMMIYGGHLD